MGEARCINAASATIGTVGATPEELMNTGCTHDTSCSVESVSSTAPCRQVFFFTISYPIFCRHDPHVPRLTIGEPASSRRRAGLAPFCSRQDSFNLLNLFNLLNFLNFFNSSHTSHHSSRRGSRACPTSFRIAAEDSCNADDQCNDSLSAYLFPVHEVMFEPMPHAGNLTKIEIIASYRKVHISFNQHIKVDHQRLLNGSSDDT